MEDFNIFEHVKKVLLALHYKDDDKDCFTTCFKRWGDVEYLEEFFENNKDDIQGNFWNETIENAVLKTLSESKKFRQRILDIAAKKNNLDLDSLFKPLKKLEDLTRQRNKAYGSNEKSWLRIYAIRLDRNQYIITGGCIKLTKAMKDRVHTNEELKKLDNAYNYLKEIGIEDGTDYGYIEIEN